MERYGDKWIHRPAIERQISSIEKSSLQQYFSPDEKLFLSAIDGLQFCEPQFDYWILPSLSGVTDNQDGEDSGINKMLQKRFEAMPFLISLLDDYTPVSSSLLNYLRLTGPWGKCMTGWHYTDPILMEEVRFMEDLLPRPVTRAEIASNILSSTIWQTEEERNSSLHMERNSKDPFSCFKPLVLNWYEHHKGMSDIELVRDYAKDAYELPNSVIRFLVEKGDDSDIALIENKLCTNELISEHDVYAYVLPYVQLRRNKADVFLDRYEKALLKYVDEELKRNLEHAEGTLIDDYKKEAQQSRDLRTRLMKILRTSTKGNLKTEEMLDEIISGKVEWNYGCKSYWIALASEDPDIGISKALKAALKSDDASLRDSIIQSAVGYRLQVNREKYAGMPSEIQIIDSHMPLWDELLQNTEKRWADISVTGRIAGEMETLYGNPPGNSMYDQLISQLGESCTEIFILRAKERIAGNKSDELTHLPSANFVSEEERQSLKQKLVKSSDLDFDKILNSMNFDERLALAEEAVKNPVLNARIVPYANRVISAKLESKRDEHLEETLKSYEKKTLNADIVRNLVDICRQEVEKGRFVSCNIVRHSNLRGVRIELKSEGPKRIENHNDSYIDQSILSINIYPNIGKECGAIWPVQVPSEVLESVNKIRFFDDKGCKITASGGSYSFDESCEIDRKQIWKVLDYFLSNEINATCSQNISISGTVGKDQ